MSNVVVEHVLFLVPMMIVIMIFPIVTTYVIGNITAEQRELIIEGAGNQLGNTIQQAYIFMSMEDIAPCTIRLSNPLPSNIESQQYEVSCIQNNDRLILCFTLPGVPLYYEHIIALGGKVSWLGGTLNSNLETAGIEVSKAPGGAITMRFR